MFQWLANWRRNRQRAIFQFWDGSKIRRIDPLVVTRALVSHPEFNWEKHPPLIELDDDQTALDALRITAKAVQDVFGVEPFDGVRGLTESECVALLEAFTSFLGGLKKSISPSLTSPPSSDTAPPTAGTTPLSSDSGSISIAPGSATPAPPELASV